MVATGRNSSGSKSGAATVYSVRLRSCSLLSASYGRAPNPSTKRSVVCGSATVSIFDEGRSAPSLRGSSCISEPFARPKDKHRWLHGLSSHGVGCDGGAWFCRSGSFAGPWLVRPEAGGPGGDIVGIADRVGKTESLAGSERPVSKFSVDFGVRSE